MNKQISFMMITATITLTAFVTIALYAGSETAQAANMTNATSAAGANMTNSTSATGANMTNSTSATGANMTQPLVPK